MSRCIFTFSSRVVPIRVYSAPCGRLYTTALGVERSDFLQTFLESHKPPQKTLDHFRATSWTRKLLEDERYEVIPFFSRHFIEHTGENHFFARTVSSDATIPHLLSLRLKEFPTQDPLSGPFQDEPPLSNRETSPTLMEVICLMSLGHGLDSHPSVVHGGFQCVIFDEIMRFLVLLHHNNICTAGPRDTHLTASMAASYFAPITTPATVLVRSRLVKRQGRKWFTMAEIADGAGQTLSRAESTWITAKPVRS